MEKSKPERKPRNPWKKPNRKGEGKVDGGCIVENINAAKADWTLFLEWQKIFSSYKSLVMIMDHHSLRLVIKNEEWVFKCVSCDVFLTSAENVNSHIQKEHHLERLHSNWARYTIENLYPLSAIMKEMNRFLEAEVATSSCSDAALRQRAAVYENISAQVLKVWPEASVNMVGSSYHGMGLADCDLNVSLCVPDDYPLAKPLMALSAAFERCPNDYQDFERHLSEEKKSLYMSFNYKGCLPCTLLVLNNRSVRLAKLLKEYGRIDDRCRKLCVLFRKWAKICSIDDQSDGYWPSYAIYLLVIYFLQQLPDPVLPVLHELIPTENGLVEVYENVADLLPAQWKTNNTSNLATLWVQLLKFYYLEFNATQHLVCITQRQKMTRNSDQEKWSLKRIGIIDPYAPQKNVAQYTNSVAYNFIIHCLRTTCLYFTVPQTKEGPIFGYVRPPLLKNKNLNVSGYAEFVETQLELTHNIVKLIPLIDTNYIIDKKANRTAIIETIRSLKDMYVNICKINIDDFNIMSARSKPKTYNYLEYCLFLDDAQYLLRLVDAKKIHYRFHYAVFSGGEEHPKCCTICSRNDHTQSKCPEIKQSKLMDIPIIDPELIMLINRVCEEVYANSKPSKNDLQIKDSLLSVLQAYIQQKFPDACLNLFGSSMNGFGLKNSDVDICMTFRNCPSSASVLPSTLKKLYQHLKEYRELKELRHIDSAKVPIIKFVHIPSQLEGDISLYNVLGLENTKLLKMYSEIDERVKILGYMVKRFAKVCNIGDASKGSLSSYCYVLMMLYFLQNCSPPVIPVLQALPKNSDHPEKIVDECNTYFFSDIDKVHEVWPEYKKNTKLPGELWIEFLRFYTEKFDIENYVVSIRSEEPLLKLEKRWFTKLFAIEDPFALAHNLGSGLSTKMNWYIINVFRKARMVFTSKSHANNKKSLADSYLNVKILAKTKPPNDRGCRVCGSIGHLARDCPNRRGPRVRDLPRRMKMIEKFPPNDRVPEALSSQTSKQVAGPSQQVYRPGPHPFNAGLFNRSTNRNSISSSQMESHQMIIQSLFNKIKAPKK